MDTLPLAFEGDRALLDVPRRALLISRTPRRPMPGTPWVQAVAAAAAETARAGEVLVTGLDRDAFQVALTVCAREGGAAIVVFEAAPDPQTLAACEDLLPTQVLFAWPREGVAAKASDAAMPARDQLLGELANRAYAIYVRKQGHMAVVAEALRARGCGVDERFAVKTPKPVKLPPPPKDLFAGGHSAWPYLTHYTREPDGAWPGETPAAYARWLAYGSRDETRGALQAFARILTTRRIVASNRLMPERAAMVCFTERTPWQLPMLMRWRKGLRRWTVRPYGLAVRREALEALGARRVEYLPPDTLEELPRNRRLFAQHMAWQHEGEWRLARDLDLAELDPAALLLIVPDPAEARALSSEFGIAAYAPKE